MRKTTDLEFKVGAATELVNLGEKGLLAIDRDSKIARLINTDGAIQESYDLSEADSIKDIYFDKESLTLYLLSLNKVWKLNL